MIDILEKAEESTKYHYIMNYFLKVIKI